jgi:hypothetical protein
MEKGSGVSPTPFSCAWCLALLGGLLGGGLLCRLLHGFLGHWRIPLSRVVYEAGRSRLSRTRNAVVWRPLRDRQEGNSRSLRPVKAGGHRWCAAAAAGPTDERRRCGARFPVRRDPPYRFFAAFFAVFFAAVFFAAAGAAFFAAFLAAAFFAILPPWWRYPISCAVIGTSLQVD